MSILQAYLPFLVLFFSKQVAQSNVVQINYGYFKEPAGHLWTYGVNAHTWTDSSGTTFKFTYWPQTSGAKIINKLQTGELDFAHLGNAPWGAGALRGIPAQMIYVIHSKDQSQSLVSHRGILKPSDLKGKRLAYIQGSTTHYMLQLLFEELALKPTDLEFYGHMSQGEQRAAWDKGEIDAGFMWGSNMRYLQENPWCANPDPTSPNYRPCDARGKGLLGYNLFTAGISKRWGKETWNNLVVRDALVARYPEVVSRVVKVIATMDTQLVENKAFFALNDNRSCSISFAIGSQCDELGLAFVRRALEFDVWLPYSTQQSGAYLAEAVPGQCALETIPSTTGSCTKETMSGSAWSTWATAEFGFDFKNFPYLPPYKYFQTLINSKFIKQVGSSEDLFPSITAESLSSALTTMNTVSDPATSFCGDLMNPLVDVALANNEVGEIIDHYGGGFYKDSGEACVWQINQSSPVQLFNISVRIETIQDNVRIYEGLCADVDSCESYGLLLARYTGGKGMSELTMENLNPRPPLFVPDGKATIIFETDGTADRPLAEIVTDGFELKYMLVATPGMCGVPCKNGGSCVLGKCRCSCLTGWFGADCSSPTCLGTQYLSASKSAQKIVHGAPGTLTGHNLDCRWIIEASKGEVVVIEFIAMDLDWTFDPLVIYNGSGVSGMLLEKQSGYYAAKLGMAIGSRCSGEQCLDIVISPSNVVTVQYTSDGMASGTGFELEVRSAELSAVRCGSGPALDCSSHGTCTSSGCLCDSGWYGKFCNLRECVGDEGTVNAEYGILRNMDASVNAYSALRSCSWIVAPPAKNSSEAGAIAFSFIRFGVEASHRSEDELFLGNVSFKGSSPPCSADIVCVLDEDCHVVGATCDFINEYGACNCPPYIITGRSAAISFKTDLNDYPPGRSFKGYEVRYDAVYDCPRKNGECLAFDECAEMRMVPSLTSCAPCEGGSVFKNVNEIAICDPCPKGRFAEMGQDRCSVCSLGRFASSMGQSECDLCVPGKFSEFEATECQLCARGTATPLKGQDKCRRCDLGTFSNGLGHDNCTRCQGDLTTQYPGASSEAQCICPLEFFRDAEDRMQCRACLEGMSCAFGADAANFGRNGTIPLVRKTYYTEGHDPLFVYLCLDDHACPGGSPGQCSGGRRGLACSRCGTNEFYDGKACIMCDPAAKGIFTLVVLACIVAVILVYYFSNGKLFNDSTHGERLSVSAGMLVTVLQLMGSLNQLQVPWPSSTKSKLSAMSFFIFDPDSLKIECLFDDVNAFQKYLLRVVVPYLALILVLALQGCTSLICRITNKCRPWESNKVVNTIGQISQILFIAFAAIFAIPFQCYSHPNGERSVVSFPNVLCGKDEHMPLMVSAFILLLTFVLPYIVVTFWANWQAPYKSVNQASHIVRYRFLLYRFRSNVWWWGSVVSIRQLLFAFSSMVDPDDPFAQIFYVVTVLWCFVALSAYFRPWKSYSLNTYENVSLVCIALLVLAVGALAPKSPNEDTYVSFMMIVVVCLFILLSSSIVVSFFLFVVDGWYFLMGIQRTPTHLKDLADLWCHLCSESIALDIDSLSFLLLSMSRYDRAMIVDVIDLFASLNTKVLEQTSRKPRRINNVLSHSSEDLQDSHWRTIRTHLSGRSNELSSSQSVAALASEGVADNGTGVGNVVTPETRLEVRLPVEESKDMVQVAMETADNQLFAISRTNTVQSILVDL